MIFGITFFITAFKLHFQANILGKGIVESNRPKTFYIHFMVISRLQRFVDMKEVERIRIVAYHKMAINTLVVHLSIKVYVP